MVNLRTGGVLAVLLALALPAALEAQGPPWERDRRSEREDRRRSDRDGDIWDVILGRRGDDRDRRDRARGGGPPFCRNGQGHPVHGRQWCRDKGFGLGNARRGAWDDVIFRTPRRDRRQLDRRDLGDILGDVVLGRVDARRGQIGARGPLSGEWLRDGRGGDALLIRAGGLALAELVDVDRDGAVDVLRLRRRH